MPTAYVPFRDLQPVQELQAQAQTVRDECLAVADRYGDNLKMKVRFSAPRDPSGRGAVSYTGRVFAVGLFVNPIVLSPDEVLPVLGPTPETAAAKQELIASRRSTTTFLRQWIEKWVAEEVLVCATLFILYPGSRVTPHYGVSNQYLRFHTCIQENLGATFHTEFDEPRTWRIGDDFCFDDHGAKHWVEFPAESAEPQARIVLSTDFHRNYYKSVYTPRVAG